MLRLPTLPLCLTLLLVTPSASAADHPARIGVRLEYERGPLAQKCPAETELRAEVAAGLGHDPFTDAGPWRLITTLNHRRDGVYVATTALFDDKGAPASTLDPLAGRDCADLVQSALATRIAAMLADRPARPPADPPAPPPPPAAPVPVPSPPPPPRPPPPDIRWKFLSVGMGGERGVLPTWVPTLALSIGVRSTLASLAFEAQTGAPLGGTGENGVAVRAFSMTGSLVGCFHRLGLEVLFLCTITSMGGYFDSPQLGATTDATGTYLGSGLRAGVEIPVVTGRSAFFLQAEALYTFVPLTVWQNERIVWQSGDVTGSAQAGVRFFL